MLDVLLSLVFRYARSVVAKGEVETVIERVSAWVAIGRRCLNAGQNPKPVAKYEKRET